MTRSRRAQGLLAAAGALALTTALAGPAGAQGRIDCGTFYRVQPGDTLRSIAVDAYGVGRYQLIFNANQALRTRPALRVGQRLFIPCADGSGPRTAEEALAAARTATGQAANPPAPAGSTAGELIPTPGDGAGRQAGPAAQPLNPGPRRMVREEVVPRPPTERELRFVARQEAAGRGSTPGAGIQPPPTEAPTAGGSQPAPATGGAAGIQPPTADRQSDGSGAAPSGAGAVAGVQPPASEYATGAQPPADGSAPSAGAVAGIQPAPSGDRPAGSADRQAAQPGLRPPPDSEAAQDRTAGGAQPAPATGATAGVQPAPDDAGATAGGSQPSPAGPVPTQEAARGTTAGIQPSPAPTRESGTATAGGLQPSPSGPAPVEETSQAAAGDLQPAAGGPGTDDTPSPDLPADDAAGTLPGLQPAPDPDAVAEATGPAEADAGPDPDLPATADPDRVAEARARSVFGLPDGAGPVEGRSRSAPELTPGGVQPLPSILPTSPEAGPAQNTPADAPGQQLALADPADPPAEDTALRQPAIRILTDSTPPYTGETLPRYGMLADVVARALGHAAPDRPYRFSFVEDRDLHLSVLLPDGAYDVGLPWFRPDCANPGTLSADLRRRCADFHWSQPLQEVVIGYFVRTGDALADAGSWGALSGRTLCRPREMPISDLESKGLATGLTRGRDAADCIAQLIEGTVEAVSVDVAEAEKVLAAGNLRGLVQEVPTLADIQTVHAVSARTNPLGRVYITLIDRGLREMRDSGEWFRVIASHLSGEAARTQ